MTGKNGFGLLWTDANVSHGEYGFGDFRSKRSFAMLRNIFLAGVCAVLFLATNQTAVAVFVDTMDLPPAGNATVADHGYTQVNHFDDGSTGGIGIRGWSYNRVDHPGELFAQQNLQGATASAVLKNDQPDLVSGTYSVSAEMTGWSSNSVINDLWFAGVVVSEDLTLADNWLAFEWYEWDDVWRTQSKATGASSVTITTIAGLTNAYTAGGIVKLEGNADGTFNFTGGGQTVSNVAVTGINSQDMAKFGVEMGNYWAGSNLSATFDNLTATVVPEPATMALLVIGGGLLVPRRRLRP